MIRKPKVAVLGAVLGAALGAVLGLSLNACVQPVTVPHGAIEIDLYSPLATDFIPIFSRSQAIAPTGPGYFSLAEAALQSPAPFGQSPAPPSYVAAFARSSNRESWVASDGSWYARAPGAPPIAIDRLSSGSPEDLQLHGEIVAVLPETGGPILWDDLTDDAPPEELGLHVTSFALYRRRIAWVEQGPSMAMVYLVDLTTGAMRQVSEEPAYARRIWSLDNEYILWGDQGASGQAFVALNTEILWIAPTD